MFTISIAGLPIGIDNRYPYLLKFCQDYLTDEPPLFTVCATDEALEQEALEAEKERIRAEKRAANPEGITDNTSKKKLQKQQQQAEEAAKAAAKHEYDVKKGIITEGDERYVIDAEQCVSCGSCADSCPVGAIVEE